MTCATRLRSWRHYFQCIYKWPFSIQNEADQKALYDDFREIKVN